MRVRQAGELASPAASEQIDCGDCAGSVSFAAQRELTFRALIVEQHAPPCGALARLLGALDEIGEEAGQRLRRPASEMTLQAG